MATLCKNCGGSLIYSPSKHKMTCKMCGAAFRPEEVSAADKELLLDKDATTEAKLFGRRDAASYECRIYTCNHCGANVIINGTEAATVCVYCGNPTVVFKRVAKEMKPDGIIPFSVPRDDAKMLIKTHLKNGRFIPKEIKEREPEEVRGIYIPYWIVNCDFHDSVIIKGKVQRGKRSETTYFGRSGSCSFERLPMDASLRLNDNIAKRLEPFFYDDAVDFDEDYLSGFYADASDMTVTDLRVAVLKRCDEMFCDEIMRSVDAKDRSVVKTCPTVNIHEDAVYIMIPAWFYTFMYKGRPHTVLVNGQTGKTVGTMPFNKYMIYGMMAGIFLTLSALSVLPFFFLGWETRVLLEMMSPYIFSGCTVLASYLFAKSVKKYKRIMGNIFDTQSSSTFLYARKRQGD